MGGLKRVYRGRKDAKFLIENLFGLSSNPLSKSADTSSAKLLPQWETMSVRELFKEVHMEEMIQS